MVSMRLCQKEKLLKKLNKRGMTSIRLALYIIYYYLKHFTKAIRFKVKCDLHATFVHTDRSGSHMSGHQIICIINEISEKRNIRSEKYKQIQKIN